MAALFVVATATADPSLDERNSAPQAAEDKLQAGIDEQAPLPSTLDDMQVLRELVSSSSLGLDKLGDPKGRVSIAGVEEFEQGLQDCKRLSARAKILLDEYKP